MAAAGEAAEAALEQAISAPEGFICVVEGAIPTANEGKYGYIAGHTMLDICGRILPKAKAVVAYGTVSYTHLDVYKRQQHWYTTLRNVAHEHVSWTISCYTAGKSGSTHPRKRGGTYSGHEMCIRDRSTET